jgi:hypothetical protein
MPRFPTRTARSLLYYAPMPPTLTLPIVTSTQSLQSAAVRPNSHYVMLKNKSRCDFAVLDDPALVMFATSARIGFMYSLLDAGASVFPKRVYDRLPRQYADATVDVVWRLFNEDKSAIVCTVLAAGETDPRVCVTPAHGADDAAIFALRYLSNFGESVVDASLSEFTRRILAAAGADQQPDVRARMEDGVVAIHMDVARRIGIADCLLAVVASKGCVTRWSNPPQHDVDMRLGPLEIEAWMSDRDVDLDAGTLLSGAIAESDLFGDPMSRVVLNASITVSDGVYETLSFCLPRDLTEVYRSLTDNPRQEAGALSDRRLARRALLKLGGNNVLPFPPQR